MPTRNPRITFLKDKYPKVNKSFFLSKKNGEIQIQKNIGSDLVFNRIIDLITQADAIFNFEKIPLTLVLIDAWCTVEKTKNIQAQIANPYIKILSFSGSEEMGVDYLIPDHYFKTLKKVTELIAKTGEAQSTTNIIGWAGIKIDFYPTKKYAPRINLETLAKTHPSIIDCQFVDNLNQVDNGLFKLPQQILNLSNKYCIDIEGYGYGGDLKFLLFSKRVCFLQSREWHEWYYYDLKPYVHYIPVKRDLSDLINQYHWIEKNPEEYKKIANNAYEFACEQLILPNALKQIKEVFTRLSGFNSTPISIPQVTKQEKQIPPPSIKKEIITKKVETTPVQKQPTTQKQLKSPYHNLATSKFWKTSVHAQPIEELSQLTKPKFQILPETKVVTAGSCFAQHLTANLRKRKFQVLDGEPGPLSLTLEEAQKFGFRLYSARYGNIYTVRQLYQLYKESLGLFKPIDAIWKKGEKYFDALRPGVEPYGVNSIEFAELQRKQHLQRVQKTFHQAEVFLFTFGLTESWEHIESGTIYPMAPGTVAGIYDPKKVRFRNFTFKEIRDDFLSFRITLKKRNPNVKFLLTVSPVHLVATATDNHVLVASTYSKSVLRAVVGQLVTEFEDVDYFPSYEIITSPSTKGKFYKDNKREVTAEGVNCVMDTFFKIHQTIPQEGEESKDTIVEKTVDKKTQESIDEEVICELALLEAFQK